jgi:hypothetical protein
MVEGGLVAGFLGLAAKPVFAAVANDSPLLQPHPGQPLPAQPQPMYAQPVQTLQPQMAQVRPAYAPVPARPRVMLDRTVNPQLVAAARASFDRHRSQVRNRDVVGIVDFSKVSREPRFYLLDTNSGQVREHFVSHGRGSDPAHTGFLHQFSNRHGSNATSEGGYVTTEYYNGKYGRSMRLRGLDWTNSNAEARAIVVHSAWYAEPSHLAQHGLLGRSEGCFALPSNSHHETMARLSPGHFLYAART